MALGHLLGAAACSSPTTRAKAGRIANVFTARGGAHDRPLQFPTGGVEV